MADRQFIVEAIFRAQDQLSKVLQTIQGNAAGLGKTLTTGALAQSGKTLDDLASRASRLGVSLSSGNFLGAARELSGIVRVANEAGAATAEAGAAAEGAAGAFGGLGSGSIIAAAGIAALGIAAVATAAAILKAADEGARYADAIGDLAGRTGIAVEDLSRLAFAAEQTDVDINSLATGIKFLQRNMVDAKNGAGDAYDAMVALGLSGEEVKRGLGDTQETLLALSARFAQVEDPALRTSLALKIFGRSGDALIPFLTAGPARIKELIETSDRLGATVSTASAKIGDEYTHALERLARANDGLKVQLSTAITPTVTGFVEKMTELVASINSVRAVMSTPLPIEAFIPAGAEKDFIETVDRMRHALELFDRVAALGVATVDLPNQSPESPATANRNATPKPQQPFGPAAPPGLDQQVMVEAMEKAEAATAKAREEATRAAAAFAKLRDELDKFVALPSTVVSGAIADKLFEVDPESATRMARDINKVIESLANDIKAKGIIIPVDLDIHKPVGLEPKTIENLDSLETIQPQLLVSNAAAADLLASFDAMGLSTDRLKEKLAVIGPELTEIGAIGVGLGDAIDQAFSVAFDPLLVGVQGVGQAVGNLRGTFDSAFDSLGKAILNGTTGFITLTGAIDGTFRALSRFVVEIGIAIVKALILRAIEAAFLSGGGTVADVGNGASSKSTGGAISRTSFASGGAARNLGAGIMRLPGFASGGGVFTQSLVRPLHAAQGLAVPGGPSTIDTVPAMLSRGEFVVPNFGTQTGTQVVKELAGGVAALRAVVEHLSGSGGGQGGSAPIFGAVHIHANDADSVRHSVRPSGEFERQMARSIELGRSSW